MQDTTEVVICFFFVPLPPSSSLKHVPEAAFRNTFTNYELTLGFSPLLSPQHPHTHAQRYDCNNPLYAARDRSLQRSNSMRVPFSLTQSMELDEWEIPVQSVIVDTKFGEGCFGEVHRGVVRGPLPSTRTMKSNICVTVAIKMLKSKK